MPVKMLPELLKARFLSGKSAKNSMAGILIYAARVVLQMATGVLLARLMSPNELGLYVFVIAVVSMGAICAQFGMTTLIVREGAAARATRDRSKLVALSQVAISTTLVGTLVITCVLAIGGWFWGGAISAFDPPAAMLGLALLPLMVAVNLGEAALEGLGKPVQGAFPSQILRSVLYFGMLTYFLFVGATLLPINAIWLQIFSQFVAAAVVLWLWRREAFRQYSEMGPNSKALGSNTRAWLRSSASFLLIHGMWVILSNTDLLMLGIMVNAEQVGFYRVASTAAAMMFLGMQALRPVLSERMSWHHTRKDTAALQRFAKIGVTGALLIALPLLVLFGIWGELFIGLLFGSEYVAAASPLLILASGQILHVAAGFAPAFLAMTGSERVNLIVLVTTAMLNVVLNLLLIPHYGSNGAAFATSISIVVQALVMWRVVYYKAGIDTSIFSWLHSNSNSTSGKRK